VCDHVAVDIVAFTNANPDRLAMKLTQYLDEALGRFEREQAAFFERVRAAYLRIAGEHPQRVRLIDATRTPDDINNILENIIGTS
jgi:dTMP kinase